MLDREGGVYGMTLVEAVKLLIARDRRQLISGIGAQSDACASVVDPHRPKPLAALPSLVRLWTSSVPPRWTASIGGGVLCRDFAISGP
jgi:hypothetical protein